MNKPPALPAIRHVGNYSSLLSQQSLAQTPVIALAHHANDQAETICSEFMSRYGYYRAYRDDKLSGTTRIWHANFAGYGDLY